MRLLADESLDRQIVDRLRLDRHDVTYIAEFAPGVLDETVLRYSRESDSILITADKDFGELVFRNRQSMAGILLIRLAGVNADMKARLVAAAIRQHGHDLPGNFAVLTDRHFRIRRGMS